MHACDKTIEHLLDSNAKAQTILGARERLRGTKISGLECQVGPKRGSYFAPLG